MSTKLFLTPLERLNRFKSVDSISGCWRFLGSTNHGYGQINIDGKIMKVHKLSAIIFLNYDPNSGLQVNHKRECKHRDCWNPDHLYIGTQKENVQDVRNPEFFNCGHRRSEENTIIKIGTNGYVISRCRECQNSIRRKSKISISFDS